VQADEIAATSDEARKQQLLTLFSTVVQELQLTSSAVWDVSRRDQSKWSSGDLYTRMLRRLEELDRQAGKKIHFPNQARDILIAETALANDLVFISADQNLVSIFEEFGGKAIHSNQLEKLYELRLSS
jgi:predicted nucleic acid-binding protein